MAPTGLAPPIFTVDLLAVESAPLYHRGSDPHVDGWTAPYEQLEQPFDAVLTTVVSDEPGEVRCWRCSRPVGYVPIWIGGSNAVKVRWRTVYLAREEGSSTVAVLCESCAVPPAAPQPSSAPSPSDSPRSLDRNEPVTAVNLAVGDVVPGRIARTLPVGSVVLWTGVSEIVRTDVGTHFTAAPEFESESARRHTPARWHPPLRDDDLYHIVLIGPRDQPAGVTE